MMRSMRAVAVLLLLPAMGGCIFGDQSQDLQDWMKEERAKLTPRVEKIAEPKSFVAQPYTGAASMEPFSPQKLAAAFKRDGGPTTDPAILKPELGRKKTPLEAFPLDAISMSGIASLPGKTVALLRIENITHQVAVGDYLGPNYGKITKITESEITLREIVQDAAGEWIERATVIKRQEAAK
jgi:type IV pilus assembly protein PilP